MAQLSSILRSGEDGRLMFRCPGCNEIHTIQHGVGIGPRWTWNGDVNYPTFSPSILVTGMLPMTEEQHEAYELGYGLPEPIPMRCHSFVADGKIQFLTDCTHALAGSTVELPPWVTTSTTDLNTLTDSEPG